MKLKVRIVTTVIALMVIASLGASKADAYSNNAKNLAGLIATTNVLDGGSSGAFTSGTDDLADLIVLGGLFPTSTSANQNAKDLAGLIAVDSVTGGSSGGSFTDGTTDLGGLLVLNNLFLDP